MKILRIVTFLLFLVPVLNVQAQSNFGGEIVSYETFGEGMMVTRAKIVPLSGVVTNMFFFNRADEPWKNNEWYEYDWEIRGAFPFSGWSQIRVRDKADTVLRDAPVNVETTTNLGDELLHYVLIRKDNRYVYDIRRDFNVSTYNYNNTAAHGGNSVSLLSDGPRVYETGGKVDHIPSWKRLDFSLGITAFDSRWSGRLPNGDYSREAEIDFTRFYTYSDAALNSKPEWSDEFSGNTLDFGKWYTADWTFAATQFRPDNVKVQDGRLFLRVNRGDSFWDPSASVDSVNLVQSDSASPSTLPMSEDLVAGNTSDTNLSTAVVAETGDSVKTEPENSAQTESGDFVQTEPRVSVQTEPEVSVQTESQVSVQTEPEVSVQTESQDSVQDETGVSVRTVSQDSAQTQSRDSVQTETGVSVQTGSTDPMTLWILAAGGLLMAQRRRLSNFTTR